MITEAEKFASNINIQVQRANLRDVQNLYYKGMLPKASLTSEKVELSRLLIERKRIEARYIQLEKVIEAVRSQLIGARLGNTLPDDSPEATKVLLDSLIARISLDMEMNYDMLDQRALERPLLLDVLEFTKKLVAKGFENIGQQLALEDQLKIFDHWTQVIHDLLSKRQEAIKQFELEKACVSERW
jgi:hypothetical protein